MGHAYALAVRRADAESLGVRSIADLAPHAPRMTIGGDYEFFGRPEWAAIASAYALRFADRVTYDPTLMYEAVATGQVDAISAFSSDGRIATHDLVVLADPAGVIPPYDAIVLLGPRVADRDDVAAALRPLVGAIDLETMQRANAMVDRAQDKRTPRQAARWLLAR
jgi:osmoprotectant transport system permease protein